MPLVKSIQQQVNSLLELAKDLARQLESKTNVHRAKKLKKELAQIVTKLKDISTKILSATGEDSYVDGFDIETARVDLLTIGNRLVVIGRSIAQGTAGKEEVAAAPDSFLLVAAQKPSNHDQQQAVRKETAQTQATGRRQKMLALANNIKVTPKHRFHGYTKCYGCMNECQLKQKVSQCLNCNQLIHKKCVEQREVSCPHCLKDFTTKV